MISKLFRNIVPVIHSPKRTMKIVAIPANQDNYQYLLVDESTQKAAIVDPVNVKSIKSAVGECGAQLSAALVTHHHSDHAGGTAELAQSFEGVTIYGGDGKRIEAINVVLGDGKQFNVGELQVNALKTPCHTSTHVCYFVKDKKTGENAVFTGDTLFIGGCGRFFEGNAEQMNEALNVKLGKLPADTKVYCGHEYTVANLEFAKSVEPTNSHVLEKLQWAKSERAAGRFTIPSTIGDEKLFNPFMRVNEPGLQKKVGTSDPIATMAKLRELKNKG